MPIIGRFKNFFGGTKNGSIRRPLPNVIKYDTDPFTEWTVLGSLGDGAFGTVQKVCRFNDQNVTAAAKNIIIEDGESVDDMTIEIAILSSLHHKNIVGLLDAYFYDNKLCIMLEFCAGGAIDNIMIELGKPLTEPQIAYVTHFVCDALIHLHASNVIHRDLKAGNILLTGDGTVKLADFGVSAKMSKNERRTSFIGTPFWMAPEVILCEAIKDQPYDTLADIWSFGITLIEMAQMDPPNSECNPIRVLMRIQKSDPPKLDRPGKWSSFFNDFLDCCLKKNPNDRCTAEQLKSHPFIMNALNPRPILELIYEKNADVLEEIIVDDDAGSLDGGSVMTGEFESSDDHLSKASPERMDIEVENRVPTNESTKQVPRKTFAAPLPPQQQDLTVSISSKANEPLKELTIDRQNSPLRMQNISPGKEAIEILDDLCNALDCDDSPSSSSSSPRRYQNHTPKLTPNSQIEEPVTTHAIRDLSNEYIKTTKEVPFNHQVRLEDKEKRNSVPQIAASFNVRPPEHHQSSRESTPKVQRTTLEIRPDDEPQPKFIVSNGRTMSADQPKTSLPVEIPTDLLMKDQQPRHSREDSGVDSQEFAAIPPPEPEVDYESNMAKPPPNVPVKMPKPEVKQELLPNKRVVDEQKSASLSSSTNSTSNEIRKPPQPIANKMLNRSVPNRATVTRKTRTYVVDGVQVTSTSLHVLGTQQDYALRKKELQELKRLQRREARDQQLLNERNEFERDTQERKFGEFRANILKDYEAELDQLCKLQKKKMEELEKLQEDERRGLAKNVKNVQEKEYRDFQLQQRDEMKRLKYETEMLPRSQRKEVYKHRREMLEQIQAERDTNFVVTKRNMSEKIMESLHQAHQEKLARLDRQFLNERHDLQRGVETALWDNELMHMKNRFELRRQQLKDNFAMQRSLMLNRFRMEQERLHKTHQNNEDLLARSLAVARKQLPKTLRMESKTRVNIFKESLQINNPDEPSHKRAQKINEFEKAEQLRLKQKLEEYNLKCQRRLDDLREANINAEAELEEIHQSKTDMIMKNETQKITEYESEYTALLEEWQNNLPVRKRDLEAKLQLEMEEQERFYKQASSGGIDHMNS